MCETFSGLLKHYRTTRVFDDRCAGEWPPEQFRKNGINYAVSGLTRSEIYLDFLPLVNSRAVELLDDDKLFRQLITLEGRTARSATDNIDRRGGWRDLQGMVASKLLDARTAAHVA